MNIEAVLLAVITCFSTILGGVFAARHRKNIGVLGAVAAGVLITTSLLDIPPQNFKLAQSANVDLEEVMAITVVGFLFLYIISRMISEHVFSKEGEYVEVKHPLGGVFCLDAPLRPNSIGLTVVNLLWRKDRILRVRGLDALNETPVLDLKLYSPARKIDKFELPEWYKNIISKVKSKGHDIIDF
jgi:tRNA (Thr-GGU) A37 N-methylase